MTTRKTHDRRTSRIMAVIMALALAASYFVVSAQTNPVEAAGTSYYVDSAAGSDGNNGTSASTPWKSLSTVNNRGFSAGDTIYFKRGSSWTGNLAIKSSGASGNPITLKAYGTGNAPAVSYPNVQWGHAIDIYGSYVVVQDFLARDGNEAGIFIQSGANNVVVQNNEITKSGEGVNISGNNALVTHNYIHDLSMVTNTSSPNNDDYGAEAIFVNKSSGAEVSYNRFVNCRAPSYDYGYDGGVLELWGNVSNVNFHHNYSQGNNGFVESGGGSSTNITIAYNVSDHDYNVFACFHPTGSFASSYNNFKMDNNTIVKTDQSWAIVDSGGSGLPSSVYFRNNVVYSATQAANGSGFTHNNNVYYFTNGAGMGSIGLGSGEKQADPKFVNMSGGDYHLQAGSPAINSGASLGYAADFDGRAVPSTPDIGAYDYGTSAPAPTATPVPPTATPVPPTATPAPTNPPVPPTATPAPTNPPAPKGTPAPTSTTAPTATPAPTSSVLWKAGMEGGNLSEWTAGGGGKVAGWGNKTVAASGTYAHSGTKSASLSISGATGTAGSAAQLVRQAEPHANPKAYYSVWYYIPQSFKIPVWWDIMNFYSVLPSGANPMWTLNVGNRSNGSMYLYMFDQVKRVSYGAVTANLPVGKWFQVEVYYQQATGTDGRVTVYQDGQQIMDMNGVATRRSGDLIDWVVSNETAGINPTNPTIYVDDAAIGTAYIK